MLKVVALLAGVVAMVPPAVMAAPIFSGSFSALASIQIYQSSAGGPVSSDSAPITGSFLVDVTRCTPSSPGNPGAQPGCNTPPQDLNVTVNLPFRSVTFSQPGGFVSVQDSMGKQILTLYAGYGFALASAQLVLVGPDNAFINGNDCQSLAPGPVDLAVSYLLVAGGREFGLTAQLTSLSFDRVSVPVPASVLLLLSMVLTCVAVRRRIEARPAAGPSWSMAPVSQSCGRRNNSLRPKLWLAS